MRYAPIAARFAAVVVFVLVAAGCRSDGADSSGIKPISVAEEVLPTMMVYKSPTCGCCSKWVDHLRAAGMDVKTTDSDDMGSIKERFGVPGKLSSCHTAVVGGYIVEGHVPFEDIQRLLTERPDAVGLAVPAMPVGSPGMEVEGRPADKYNVLLFDANGNQRVYASH
ncbi:MAG: DUF411 domain-containing protein [Rhodothermales bacterium]|nr:DUF411 domain-containing protein [Rhodothermales bacterium]